MALAESEYGLNAQVSETIQRVGQLALAQLGDLLHPVVIFSLLIRSKSKWTGCWIVAQYYYHFVVTQDLSWYCPRRFAYTNLYYEVSS